MPSPPSPAQPRFSKRLVFGLVLIAFTLSVLYPLRQYGASKAQLRALLRQEQQIEQRTQDLQKQKDRLSSDAEIERLAREHLHMVRPGEAAFAITGRPSTPKATAAPKPASPKPSKRPWYKSFWRWLAGD